MSISSSRELSCKSGFILSVNTRRLRNVCIVVLSMTLLQGCATMFEGTTQRFMVKTVRDTGKDTLCIASNEEGLWPSLVPQETANIYRDGNTMLVECENTAQKGVTNVEPNFKGSYIFLNFLLDFCTISCVVDGVSNSWYEYPTLVVVPMVNKN